ncbi:hypothetical protein AYO44_14635 [Planctomycetaceae bacterium SCGC AG-212-F19]|nr:hypothetical protein AYO44_14635 [Planctomycetaceae bacterium SCGC AG-212-F19]
MLRIVLIGVGVVTAAVTGWVVKRQFFTATDDTPPVVIQMPQVYRPGSRRKKGQRVEVSPTFDNGERGDPAA